MKAELKHLNCEVRVVNEDSRFFGDRGRVVTVRHQDGKTYVYVQFPNYIGYADSYHFYEDDLELEDCVDWKSLYRENKILKEKLKEIEANEGLRWREE